MTPRGPGTGPPADGPMDDVDFGLLDDIGELFEAIDPMPADLPERIRFALSLRDLETEVARLAEEDLSAVGVRGAESSRTITFDSESLTIMIRVDANTDGTVRIDGWLAPPQTGQKPCVARQCSMPRAVANIVASSGGSKAVRLRRSVNAPVISGSTEDGSSSCERSIAKTGIAFCSPRNTQGAATAGLATSAARGLASPSISALPRQNSVNRLRASSSAAASQAASARRCPARSSVPPV